MKSEKRSDAGVSGASMCEGQAGDGRVRDREARERGANAVAGPALTLPSSTVHRCAHTPTHPLITTTPLITLNLIWLAFLP